MNFRKIFLNFENFMFLVSQLVAGLLNYFFQIQAARDLSAEQFGDWSKWLAGFSVACFVGLGLQSLSVLSELEKYLTLKTSRILGVFLALLIGLTMTLNISHGLVVLAWLSQLGAGFWIGVNLRRRHMFIISISTFLAAISKFVWIFFDKTANSFFHAVYAGCFFLCGSLLLLSKRADPRSTDLSLSKSLAPAVLVSSISLAFFMAWAPQVDLLTAPKLLLAQDLGLFAKVALLYKAYFFGFQIVAQILLSHQVSAERSEIKGSYFIFMLGAGLLVSFAGIGIAKYLDWPVLWVFLSLVHMTSLCLLYLAVQDFSARGRAWNALALCCTSLVITFLTFQTKPSVEMYWILATLMELGGLFLWTRWRRYRTT